MEELSIKIKIGDREYPMRVSPEEEQTLRAAGKLVNERIRDYRSQFGINEMQDLLAMVAFDCLVEKLKAENEKTSVSHSVNEKIARLDELISTALS